MWSVESVADIPAEPAAVWELYADPSTWDEWAHSTASARAQGDISVGEEVIIQPTRGPEQRVRIVALEPQRRLETELSLPGAIMRFGYEIEPHDQGCSIRHTVAMVGPLSSVYGLVVRGRNQRELARETARLRKRFADSGTPEP